jgi:hypothetical protein
MGGEAQLRDDFRQLGEGAMQGHRSGGGKRDFNPEFRVVCGRGGGLTERFCQRGSGRSYFNEPLGRSTVVALAVSVILKTRERDPASLAERRLRLIAPLVIREDRVPLVERFSLVHTEPSRNTGPALEGPGETLTIIRKIAVTARREAVCKVKLSFHTASPLCSDC